MLWIVIVRKEEVLKNLNMKCKILWVEKLFLKAKEIYYLTNLLQVQILINMFTLIQT